MVPIFTVDLKIKIELLLNLFFNSFIKLNKFFRLIFLLLSIGVPSVMKIILNLKKLIIRILI